MKIKIITIGKPESRLFKDAVDHYLSRINRYVQVEIIHLQQPKGLRNAQVLKEMECALFLNKISASDFIVLLDERGREFTSVEYAALISNWQIRNLKTVTFLFGGAYGFDELLYKRANEKIALSRFTLQHDVALLVFVEQLYRAFTILRGESYHHQ